MRRTTACLALLIVSIALLVIISPQVTAASSRMRATGAGRIRTYYIAADPVEWDYASAGRNLITDAPFGEEERDFTERGPSRIGSRYLKSLFRAYADPDFLTLVAPSPQWEHLGMLGPVIRAEVGDTVEVVFRNNTPFRASLHPHGLLYDKDSEGAAYADGTSGEDRTDDAVPPGRSRRYVWEVPERAGPAASDGSSVMWMYHSHADEVADVNAGLMGPIIVTRKGMARPDGSPKDVDREIVTSFTVVDENTSPWVQENRRRYLGRPESVNQFDEDFKESNRKHAINGSIYGNLRGLDMRQGERVRWYLMGMGNEMDIHTPHWHGQTVVTAGMRTDVVSLLPASMAAVDMVVDAPGTWLFHCHVTDHLQAGMQALFRVEPSQQR